MNAVAVAAVVCSKKNKKIFIHNTFGIDFLTNFMLLHLLM